MRQKSVNLIKSHNGLTLIKFLNGLKESQKFYEGL